MRASADRQGKYSTIRNKKRTNYLKSWGENAAKIRQKAS
jgi:hypothetical protein